MGKRKGLNKMRDLCARKMKNGQKKKNLLLLTRETTKMK